jgi:hypothetical protein
MCTKSLLRHRSDKHAERSNTETLIRFIHDIPRVEHCRAKSILESTPV